MMGCIPVIYMENSRAEKESPALYSFVDTTPSMRWALDLAVNPTNCIISMLAPSYTLEKKGGSVSMSLRSATAWTRSGEPRLPVFPVVLEVSDDTTYQISVETGDAGKRMIGYLDPVPTAGNVSESDDVGRVVEYLIPDSNIYRQNAYWPPQLYSVDEAKGGGKRFLRIGVQPFQYNSWSQTLRFYSNLQVRVSFSRVDPQPYP
jgi:hypothetical protein